MAKLATGKEFTPKLNTLAKKGSDAPNIVLSGVVRKIFYNFEKTDNGQIYPPGTIEVSLLISNRGGSTIRAFPYDSQLLNLPILGESVEIFNVSRRPYYRRKNFATNLNASNKELNATFKSNTFKPDTTHRLKLYEGDFVIQSRFGQSIRFSGYNNEKNSVSPVLIIRNRESELEKAKAIDSEILEDVNRDGSTITISSNKYISDFIPGTIDKGGNSDFELKVWQKNDKYAIEEYPKKLDGDQIIISSDRIILSSKAKEMMFFSKGPQSFVTDSYFTFDTNKGMSFVSQNGDIQFEANNKETKFFVGKSGKIFLGVDKESPTYALVNGKALTDWLADFVQLMITQTTAGGILTGGGPSTGLNPAYQQQLTSLLNKLPNVLSKKVFIGM